MAERAILQGRLVVEQDKAARVVKQAYYVRLKEIFTERNIPFVVARYEGEQTCAWMLQKGHADILISDDYDCLPCGAPFFVQHFRSSQYPTRRIFLAPLLEHLRMTQAEFVDFCILLGSDFGGSIHGIGPKRALDIIRKHKNINSFLASTDGKKFRDSIVSKTSGPGMGDDSEGPEGVKAREFNYDVPRIMFTDDTFPLLSRGTILNFPAYALLHAFITENDTPPTEIVTSVKAAAKSNSIVTKSSAIIMDTGAPPSRIGKEGSRRAQQEEDESSSLSDATHATAPRKYARIVAI